MCGRFPVSSVPRGARRSGFSRLWFLAFEVSV